MKFGWKILSEHFFQRFQNSIPRRSAPSQKRNRQILFVIVSFLKMSTIFFNRSLGITNMVLENPPSEDPRRGQARLRDGGRVRRRAAVRRRQRRCADRARGGVGQRGAPGGLRPLHARRWGAPLPQDAVDAFGQGATDRPHRLPPMRTRPLSMSAYQNDCSVGFFGVLCERE